MKLIAVTEIYGKTPEFEKLIAEISGSYASCVIIDPYDGKCVDFDSEDAAYCYFQENSGLDRLVDLLTQALEDSVEPVELIGFSVGASAVWKVTGQALSRGVARAICYYGSQIRNMTDVDPLCETEVVFPKYETHFDVERLMDRISGKENVRCIKTEFLHGFMNRRSKNFDEAGYLENIIRLMKNAG